MLMVQCTLLIHSYKYNTNSAEDSSNVSSILLRSLRVCACLCQGSNPDRTSENPSR